jgi:glutathione-regulated potassium-efflux system ancillary protein KefC
VLAFALSFSSTVFAVKVLEEKGEMGSLYGTIAIGILIMQDLAAVIFLAFSAGKVPSLWAVLLLALFPAPRLLLAARAGRAWRAAAAVRADAGPRRCRAVRAVQVKGDLGALLLGVMIASHPKAGELAKSLLGLKDLFLVGFFPEHRARGDAEPGHGAGGGAAAGVLVVFKGFLFEQLLLRFGCARARPSGRAGAVQLQRVRAHRRRGGAKNGWLPPDWLAIVAITLALSFVVASPLNAQSHVLYELFSPGCGARSASSGAAEEREIDPGDANVMIVGMGRVGSGAYDELVHEKGLRPVGIDADPDSVPKQKAAGRNVVQGSATDADFWHRLHLDDGHIKLVLLAMPQVLRECLRR